MEALAKDNELFTAVFNDCMKSNSNNALSSGELSAVVDFGDEE
jgi:hypothetical protein